MLATNERLKEMLVSGTTKDVQVSTDILGTKDLTQPHLGLPIKPVIMRTAYEAVLEVSKSFDKKLTSNVQSALRNFFITSIIGQWFNQAGEMMDGAERLLYSRKKPTRPSD